MAKSRKRTPGEATLEPPSDQPLAPESGADISSNGHADRIAERAYELYLARGGEHGNDWEDWLTAEREITGSCRDSEER